MKKLIFAGIACMTLISSGCTDVAEDEGVLICPEPKSNPVKAIWPDYPLSVIGEKNAAKSNEFATSLLKEMYSRTEENICISPASVFCTLAMMANGDDGESRDEILHLLGYEEGEEGLQELNAYSNALLAEVTDFNGDTQCGFTNSLWHHPEFNLLTSFTDDMWKIFGAADVPIWLGDEEGRLAVNEFVKENTRGMITEFLKEPMEVSLGILNTTYFKGTWNQKFDKHLTHNGSFHNADMSASQVSYMTLTDFIAHSEAGGINAVRLPYTDNRYTMTLLQPAEKDGFKSMLDALDGDLISAITSSLLSDQVELHLPKFEHELNEDILGCLKELGLKQACHRGLMKIDGSGDPLLLDFFIHAVKIRVDEEGSEGGAASMSGLLTTSFPNDTDEPIVIEFDRPFVYLIRDNISGTVLFMGAITSF